MEIILSNLCDSLTGSLSKKHGYSIRRTQDGKFVGQRKSKGHVPPDGHWRFIVDCAQMAQSTLFITDVKISREELKKALEEARCFIAMQNLRLPLYHARDILNLKTTFGL